MNPWDARAAIYRYARSAWPLSAIFNLEKRNILDLLGHIDCASGRVLDLGCGVGHSFEFAANAQFVVGLDKSRKMARQAKRASGHPVVVGDALAPPFRPGVFDFVIAVGLSEYIRDLQSLWKALEPLTETGAHLLLTASPPGIFTRLRLLAGSLIYPRKAESIIRQAKERGYSLIAQRHSFSQDAFLFRKDSEANCLPTV